MTPPSSLTRSCAPSRHPYVARAPRTLAIRAALHASWEQKARPALEVFDAVADFSYNRKDLGPTVTVREWLNSADTPNAQIGDAPAAGGNDADDTPAHEASVDADGEWSV